MATEKDSLTEDTSQRTNSDTRTQDQLITSPTREEPRPYNKDSTLPLYMIDQVPLYLRDNQYILSGYRAYYTTYRCFTSVLRLHNETFNIWTHLLGAFCFVGLVIHLFVTVLVPEYRARNAASGARTPVSSLAFSEVSMSSAGGKSVSEKYPAWSLVLFGVYSAGCLGCMTCSALYHTLVAHISEPCYRVAHALDYFGITLLIVGSFLPFCFYVFACLPVWRDVYIGMILLFGFFGMLGPFFRQWTSTAFATKKVLFYVCMVGSGIIPIVHVLFLPSHLGLPYLWGLLLMMFLYGAGVFFYAFKIPEIFCPGRFDIYLSSHQIFHLFVVGAALVHFFNCIDMYKNMSKMVCDKT